MRGRLLAVLLALMSPAAVGQISGPRLLEVSFAGGRDILRDDGSGPYSAPHRRAAAAARHPNLMKSGESLVVAIAKFQVSGVITGTLMIRGTREDSLDVPRTIASRVVGTTDVYEITNVRLAAPFSLNQIAFYDPFDVRWEVSRDAGNTWESAGASSNPIYVCLTDDGTPRPFLTIVHAACSR